MTQDINTVGQTPLEGNQWSAGIAYVAIPSDLERDVYITECYLNEKISIWTEDGAFFNRVPVNIDTLNFIEFPLTFKELGTAVLYITEPVHKQPLIVARYSKIDELGERRENLFKIKRKLGNKFVEISGSTKSNSLNLIVNSENEIGEVNIRVINSNDNGKLSLEVAGDIEINSTGEISLVQKKRIFINTVGLDGQDDSEASFEQTSEENRFNGKKFILNQGEQSMVLGNKLVSFLETFIEQVANITTTTVIGIQPVMNKIQLLELKKKLNDVLSSEGFLKQ